MHNPRIIKRLAVASYELLILIAIWLVCSGLLIALFGDATVGLKRFALQLTLWSVTGVYFIWCWKKSGQTVAMKTWKLQLVSQNGMPLTYRQLVLRYVFASFGLFAAGAGFLWMVFDRESLFLHDRLTGCRLVNVTQK